MKTLVTGAAGFIGSHLCDELLKLGHQVVAVDNLSTGNDVNVSTRCIKYIGPQWDICDFNTLCTQIMSSDIDVVFHVAALPRVQFSIANPMLTHCSNINGTLNILMACREFNIKRCVYSSSSSVYGNQKTLPITETMQPNPLSPYALHKWVGEEYCRLFHELYGLETVSLRYFNIFGERQDPLSEYSCLIPKTIYKVLHNESPVIYGDGETTRDFNHVSDVVNANILAATTNNQEMFGKVINIGSGEAYSVNHVVYVIKSIAGKTAIKNIYTDPVIEAKHTRADNSLAKKLLRWEPQVSIAKGLTKTVDYFIKKANIHGQNE